MKTEKLYDKDSYIKEFEAVVLTCKEHCGKWAVLLDKTAFFPEAGGQKSDRGYIDGAVVSDVQITEEGIYHIIDKPLCEGKTVKGSIDWSRRFDFMQQHSGEHIISGVANRLYGCENVGFHLNEELVTLDFDKLLTKDQLSKIEMLSNEKIYENVGFNCYYPDNETLKSLDYRSKKELFGEIRIVEIENTDRCACCAPHVKSAGEIGIIKMLSAETLRGGLRIQFKCGRRAFEDYCLKHTNNAEISSLLCVKPEQTALGVEKLAAGLKEAQYKLAGLKRKQLIDLAESFSSESDKSALFLEDIEPKLLGEAADLLYKRAGGIRGVFCEKENGFSFAICGQENRLNIFFADFKANLSVKGGGRNGLVQGTVIAEKEKIEGFFNT